MCDLWTLIKFSWFNFDSINLLFLAKYIKGDGGVVILKNKEQIPVSRAKKDELVSKLKSISGH